MLNFGWMWRGLELEIKELQNLLSEFEEAGYNFVLLTVASEKADFVPKAAYLLDKNTKIKMMFAMRPHLLSPQYAAMLFAGFDQIEPGRVMVNWVNGYDKAKVDEVLGLPENFMNPPVRDAYIEEYFDKLDKVFIEGQESLPVQVIPVNRRFTMELAKKHGMYPILHYNQFENKYSELVELGFDRIFVEGSIFVLEDGVDKEVETKRVLSSLSSGYARGSTIIGYESDIIEELKRLEQLGVTDFLIGGLDDDDNGELREMTHKIVRKLVG